MGCGASSTKDKGGQNQKAANDNKNPPSEQKYKEENRDKSTKSPEGKGVASPTATKPLPTSPQGGSAPAPDEGASVGRAKHMPGPLMALVTLSEDKEASCLVSAYGHISNMSGLTIAVYNMKSQETFSKSMTDSELISTIETLTQPPMPVQTFWKMFASAMSKADIKLTKQGMHFELKMKSKQDPKDASLQLDLTKEDTPYDHFINIIPRIFQQKRRQMEEEAKEEKGKEDSKKLRELELAKKEAEYNISESIVLAGQDAEERLTPMLSVLREKSGTAQASLGEITAEIAKTKQEIEKLANGAPSHPLDTIYSCDIPPVPEAKPVGDLSALGWDTDVDDLDISLPDIAVALYQEHGLIETFDIDKQTVANFYHMVSLKCHDVPYHGHRRAIDCMIIMHFILQKLEATIKFAKEDILACFICAGILDLDHEGLDDQFIKRAGSMLSMLYSDLYQNTQNNLTVAAELFFNPKLDLLKTLTPDQIKDVTETVREALFIKANVQMKMPRDRLADFKALSASGADWSTKDNLRHVITHAVRMVDWSAWGRPQALHKKWMARVSEEYYRQGDQELAIGLAPSNFHDTCWTTERKRHDLTFARGQSTFIEQVILPLFEEMARLASGLDGCVKDAKANKDAFDSECGSGGAALKSALQGTPKLFGDTDDSVTFARIGPDGSSLWITIAGKNGKVYDAVYDDVALEKRNVHEGAKFLEDLTNAFKDDTAKAKIQSDKAILTVGSVQLDLALEPDRSVKELAPYIKSFLELRGLSAMRYVDKKVDEVKSHAAAMGNKSNALHGEEKALQGCIEACAKKTAELTPELARLKQVLQEEGGHPVKVEKEDALQIKVRNPLRAPLPPGVTEPPNRKEVDPELLKVLKSKYYTKEHGAEADLTELPDPTKVKGCNAIMPYLTSEFMQVTKTLGDEKRQRVYNVVSKLDDWDYDVFDLQETMSGGISGENLRNQPDGGALFITAYALMFKWGFMQKFNIDEVTLLNWLSIVEAGYHPNPYHNSMHAADVLHVTHYILGPGGCREKVKASDEEVFAALFAACVHDYNHPGINNAFHVRSQNYLAVLFNDRSVNENIHASSVFELMRMDKFNILKAFQGQAYTNMRDDIVEFILGTDMGLHAMILSRFKKRLEVTDSKMHKSKADKNLAITMAVKMADISNCGRPQKLYHGWCNVIVDEFFQQGDRERLQGMPVSPFMDRFTTVMAKGQIGFMNYIVMPLFECMGEFLEPMGRASLIAEENKGFWQENEDW